jgi:hypothetical protein
MNNVELNLHVNNAILKMDEAQRAFEAKCAEFDAFKSSVNALVAAAVKAELAKLDSQAFGDGQGGTLTVPVLARKAK